MSDRNVAKLGARTVQGFKLLGEKRKRKIIKKRKGYDIIYAQKC